MKKLIRKINTKGFSHVELFFIIIVLVAIGGVAYYGISKAANNWSNLASIDLGGQSFKEMACVESVHSSTYALQGQLTVNRDAGVSSYNPLGVVRIASNPVSTTAHDNWNPGSTSTLTFSFSISSSLRFRLGVEGKINGSLQTIYGPSYTPQAIARCAAQKSGNSRAVSSDSVTWPFPTKGSSQYFRIDQGWDIQSSSGVNIYAIAPGIISVASPNPGGFGNNYPVESLDYNIGGPSTWVYYGHVHVIPSVVGKRVVQGQTIATANQYSGQNGSAAPAGWLEIGFAVPGSGQPYAQIEQGDYGEGAATAAGQTMYDILIDAPLN